MDWRKKLRRARERAREIVNDPNRVLAEVPDDTPEELARYLPSSPEQLAADNAMVLQMVESMDPSEFIQCDAPGPDDFQSLEEFFEALRLEEEEERAARGRPN